MAQANVSEYLNYDSDWKNFIDKPTSTCPKMVQGKEQLEVTVAGITDTISRKRPNTGCWIGCTGYEELAASETWSFLAVNAHLRKSNNHFPRTSSHWLVK